MPGWRTLSQRAICGAAITAAAGTALAAPSLFPSDPTWSAPNAAPTIRVVVADVDGDGDLDVLRAGAGNPSGLYINPGGKLENAPNWTSVSPDSVTSAAVADVSGDGQPDLVLATVRGEVTLYIQTQAPEYFPATPSQTLLLGGTTGIALADIDGDGDLDLIVCRAASGIELHRNTRGTFETTAAWSATETASCAAVGDVDGDGNLDLVTAATGSGMHLYRGDGNLFGTTPAWTQSEDGTTSIALGDLDGDGDLDLVAGGFRLHPTEFFENLGATFGPLPAAVLAGEDSTRAVALGDADGDGDLDLVCANEDPARVYRNPGTLDGWTAVWESPGRQTSDAVWADIDSDGYRDLLLAADHTALFHNLTLPFRPASDTTAILGRPLLLADLDADGDPDLVAGDGASPGRLHLNDGGRFAAASAWTTGAGTRVAACAAGDVNHDGKPDLVVGGALGLGLYLHQDTLFGTGPDWFVALPSISVVALGDVDADGDLDLVVGLDAINASVALFLNRNGTFAAVPDWSGGNGAIVSLAMGDVDEDGDLDLAAGSGTEASLWLFDANGFGTQAVWGAIGRTTRLRFDDVNRDGSVDLLVGRIGISAVYANEHGELAVTPTWASPAPRSDLDTAIADIDTDGDLDVLFLGGNGDPSEIVWNAGGQLAAAAPLPATSGTHSELADVDQDGHFDIVAGDPAGTIEVFRSAAGPVLHGGPATVANRLPGNDPFVRAVQVTATHDNVRRVDFTAFDLESDSLWVAPEYQARGSGVWTPIDTNDRRPRVGPFAASPAGIGSGFDWDLSRLAGTALPLELRLRTIPVRPRNGAPQRLASYLYSVGRVLLVRPHIELDTNLLTFPTLTVGDSASIILTIRNTGNDTLRIGGFDSERDSGLRINPSAVPVAPGVLTQVIVSFEPRVALPAPTAQHQRFLNISSDDPLQPRLPLPVVSEALALAGRTQALVTTPTAPLGVPIVVQVIPAPSVHIEAAWLFYGATGSAVFDSLRMDPFGPDFLASIPGPRVTENGVHFYTRFENSGIVTTDPVGAPRAPVFRQAVSPPDFIRAIPQPTSRADFLVGRDINVEVVLPVGAEFRGGTLHYRQGGTRAFSSEPVRVDFLGNARGIIPASAVGPGGLEYYVEARTASPRTLWFPPDSTSAPDSIRTLVPSLAEASVHPGGRYRMLSVPLEFGAASPRPLDALLVDQAEFGAYDPLRWRAFRFLGEAAGTVERQPNDSLFNVVPGRAFWIVSRADHQVDTAPAEGLSMPAAARFPLVLAPGWNQIGHPFAFPVAWASVTVPPGVEPPVGFDPNLGTSGGYGSEPVSVLEPFAGYFVWNGSASAETLRVAPVAFEPDRAALAVAKPVVNGAWSIDITARTRAAVDADNRAVVDPQAADHLDRFDLHEPPPAPENWVGAAFVTPGGTSPTSPSAPSLGATRLLRRDARAPNPAGHTWGLELRSSRRAEEIQLDVHLNGTLPAEFTLAVLDVEAGSLMPLATNTGTRDWQGVTHLVSRGPDRPIELRLLAGTASYLAGETQRLTSPPARVALDQNAPNPFNATTRLRFGLPERARARLEIFDVRGRRVTVLVDRELPAGWHTVTWNGRDAAGHSVASGVYLCRLHTPAIIVTRRMALLE